MKSIILLCVCLSVVFVAAAEQQQQQEDSRRRLQRLSLQLEDQDDDDSLTKRLVKSSHHRYNHAHGRLYDDLHKDNAHERHHKDDGHDRKEQYKRRDDRDRHYQNDKRDKKNLREDDDQDGDDPHSLRSYGAKAYPYQDEKSYYYKDQHAKSRFNYADNYALAYNQNLPAYPYQDEKSYNNDQYANARTEYAENYPLAYSQNLLLKNKPYRDFFYNQNFLGRQDELNYDFYKYKALDYNGDQSLYKGFDNFNYADQFNKKYYGFDPQSNSDYSLKYMDQYYKNGASFKPYFSGYDSMYPRAYNNDYYKQYDSLYKYKYMPKSDDDSYLNYNSYAKSKLLNYPRSYNRDDAYYYNSYDQSYKYNAFKPLDGYNHYLSSNSRLNKPLNCGFSALCN